MINDYASVVSVITPAYNSEKYILATAKSILEDKAVGEWIVIDDASTDGTLKVLAGIDDPRLKLISKKKNGGLLDSMGIGVDLASLEYLVVVDHDDIVPAGSISERVKLLSMHPSVQVATGPVNYMDENAKIYKTKMLPRGWYGLVSSKKALLDIFISPTYPIKQGAVLVRTQFAKKEGCFDIELFLNAARVGVCALSVPTLNYRTHRGQFSGRRLGRLRSFFRFFWVRYCFRYLPIWQAVPLALYKLIIDVAKVVWIQFSSKKI